MSDFGFGDTGYDDPQLVWSTIYPIFVRRRLKDAKVGTASIVWDETMVHIASSRQKAIEFCQRNTDYFKRDDPEHWWWFTVTQDAIDGEFSGIRGVVMFLNWDGEKLSYDPASGYKTKEELEEMHKCGDKGCALCYEQPVVADPNATVAEVEPVGATDTPVSVT